MLHSALRWAYTNRGARKVCLPSLLSFGPSRRSAFSTPARPPWTGPAPPELAQSVMPASPPPAPPAPTLPAPAENVDQVLDEIRWAAAACLLPLCHPAFRSLPLLAPPSMCCPCLVTCCAFFVAERQAGTPVNCCCHPLQPCTQAALVWLTGLSYHPLHHPLLQALPRWHRRRRPGACGAGWTHCKGKRGEGGP